METKSIGGIICANENKGSRLRVHYLIGFLTALFQLVPMLHLHFLPGVSFCASDADNP
jgi:hypothetical protein